ncbi:hypothetical protein Ndes2437B_g06477 [Nannochloris sp. 'desiccata']
MDNDGNLSIEEVLKVIESEHAARASKKMYKRVLLVVGIASLVLVGALCGITYGIVDLTKEVNTDSSNHITSSSTGDIASVGTAKQTFPLSSLYLSDDAKLVASFEKLVVNGEEAGEYTVHSVKAISVVPDVSATIATESGDSFIVDQFGLRPANATLETSGRRRLLFYTGYPSQPCGFCCWGCFGISIF